MQEEMDAATDARKQFSRRQGIALSRTQSPSGTVPPSSFYWPQQCTYRVYKQATRGRHGARAPDYCVNSDLLEAIMESAPQSLC
jgi:hypothetical protein